MPGIKTPVIGWSYILVKRLRPSLRLRHPFTAPNLLVDSEKLAKRIAGSLNLKGPFQ